MLEGNPRQGDKDALKTLLGEKISFGLDMLQRTPLHPL
jgi:hypothetical protein